MNGSGKSTAMNMLLPFLLDADVRRIDAAGEHAGMHPSGCKLDSTVGPDAYRHRRAFPWVSPALTGSTVRATRWSRAGCATT